MWCGQQVMRTLMTQKHWPPIYWAGLYYMYTNSRRTRSLKGFTTLYSKSHEYIQYDEKTKTGCCGLSKYGANEINDIVYVEFEQEGKHLQVGDTVCQIENSKDVFDVVSLADGEITEVNGEVLENVQDIITAPESKGWIWKMKVTKLSSELMGSEEYQKFCDDSEM